MMLRHIRTIPFFWFTRSPVSHRLCNFIFFFVRLIESTSHAMAFYFSVFVVVVVVRIDLIVYPWNRIWNRPHFLCCVSGVVRHLLLRQIGFILDLFRRTLKFRGSGCPEMKLMLPKHKINRKKRFQQLANADEQKKISSKILSLQFLSLKVAFFVNCITYVIHQTFNRPKFSSDSSPSVNVTKSKMSEKLIVKLIIFNSRFFSGTTSSIYELNNNLLLLRNP